MADNDITEVPDGRRLRSERSRQAIIDASLALIEEGVHEIEITGAGYDTNLYWLTSNELAQVKFSTVYEADFAALELLDTATLITNLYNFSPQAAGH